MYSVPSIIWLLSFTHRWVDVWCRHIDEALDRLSLWNAELFESNRLSLVNPTLISESWNHSANQSIMFSGSYSYSGLNEEIMYATIGMGIIIIILISVALCYIGVEKYQKRRDREYYLNAWSVLLLVTVDPPRTHRRPTENHTTFREMFRCFVKKWIRNINCGDELFVFESRNIDIGDTERPQELAQETACWQEVHKLLLLLFFDGTPFLVE